MLPTKNYVDRPKTNSTIALTKKIVNFLMVEIPTPKPYIFMIRVTRQIKCLIAQAPGGHTPPLPDGLGGDLGHIFLNRFPSGVGLSPGDKKCGMHNFTNSL
jgi:hypothetical protein